MKRVTRFEQAVKTVWHWNSVLGKELENDVDMLVWACSECEPTAGDHGYGNIRAGGGTLEPSSSRVCAGVD